MDNDCKTPFDSHFLPSRSYKTEVYLVYLLSETLCFYTGLALKHLGTIVERRQRTFITRTPAVCIPIVVHLIFSNPIHTLMQRMSRHVILPRAFGKEGRNSSTLCAKTFMK